MYAIRSYYATLAKTMLQQQKAAGYGSTVMFQGQSWYDDNWNPISAAVTINAVLANTAVMNASAEAAIAIDDQIAVLKAETGRNNFV